MERLFTFGFLSRFARVDASGAEADIPRYPPFMQGLPAVEASRIVATQQELVEAILRAASPERRQREHYLNAIQAFAEHAHLLPASQAHHHRGAGGLFRHSLEVALYALQMAHKHLAFPDATPAARREMEPRWVFAAFYCGLYHDAGKPCTDVVVFDERRQAAWSPLTQRLHDWALSQGIDRYYLEWRDGRGRSHVALSQVVAFRMISHETLDWIMRGGVDLLSWMSETLADNPSPTNPLPAIVVKADQLSVERDLRSAGMQMAGHDIGLPVERMLQDIMRGLVREGVWLVNSPGARVWKIAGETYLIWPAGGDEVADVIRREKLPGMPRTTNALLDMMVERGLASIRNDAAQPLWRILPDILADSAGKTSLTAIRLKSDSLVSVVPLQDVEGVLVEDQRSQPMRSMQTITKKDTDEPVDQPETSAAAPTQNAIASHTKDKPASLSGPAWHVLLALAEDIASAARDGEMLMSMAPDGGVLLRWPDALEGYGIDVKALLEEMKTRGWVIPDPVSPMRYVMEADFGVVRAKAIWLKGAPADRFAEIISNKDAREMPKPAGGDDLIDRLLEALTDHAPSRPEDEWVAVPRYRALTALRKLGVEDAARALAGLCERHADKLVVKGNSVAFRK